MKKKLSLLEALIKARNFKISDLEEKISAPKGYISRVITGKQSMSPTTFIKLLEELNITLEEYIKLNEYAKELRTDSKISNDIRWQKLLVKILFEYPLKNNEEQKYIDKKIQKSRLDLLFYAILIKNRRYV